MLAILLAGALLQEIVPTAPSETAPLPPAAASHQPSPPPSGPPPGDLSAAPPLPEGLLLPVARSDNGETFLVLDRAAHNGLIVDYWTYLIFEPPVAIRAGVAALQGLAHHQADCAAKTDQVIAQAGYDAAGAPVVALAAEPMRPIAEAGPEALIVEALCRDRRLPRESAVAGHAAALALAKQPPSRQNP